MKYVIEGNEMVSTNESEMNEAPILVADDDEHTVELVSLYLRRAGYRVETACDGDETLRKVKESQPALIVLDIMMPGPDGLQICRKLRGRMPILLLTARASDIDRIAGLRLGADDYVTKPFNPDELVARVGAVLRRTDPTSRTSVERTQVGEAGDRFGLAARPAPARGRCRSRPRSSTCSSRLPTSRTSCSTETGCSTWHGARPSTGTGPWTCTWRGFARS